MANTYLTKQMGAGTSGQKFTFSAWIKRSGLTQAQLWESYHASNYRISLYIHSDNVLSLYAESGASVIGQHKSTRVLRDTNAYYHIVYAVDTTQATSTNREKFYINGELIPDSEMTGTNTYYTQNLSLPIGTSSYNHVIGRYSGDNNYFDGYMSHVHFTDGYTYDASAFGSTDATTGEWQINTSPSVTYGNNGFFILKDGNSVTDQSGNSNNFTVGGGTLTKTEDSPSNVFATWNALANQGSVPLYNGNTRAVFTAGGWNFVYSTLGASSGKYYYEVKAANTGSDSNIGIMEMDTATNEQGTADNVGKNTESVAYASNGSIKKNNVTVQTGLGSISTGNILGIAMDLDNNTVQFYLQGVARGTAVSIASDKTYAFATSGYTSAEHQTNFGNGYFETTAVSSAGTNASGNGIFEYDVPTGFTALSTKGLNL